MNLSITRLAVPLVLAAGLLAGCGGIPISRKSASLAARPRCNRRSRPSGIRAGRVGAATREENLDAARKAMKTARVTGQALTLSSRSSTPSAPVEVANCSARKAADEVLASIKTLRQEAERPTATDSQPYDDDK